jgi:hypothetical protein
VRKRYTVRLKHHRKVAPFAYEQDIPGYQEGDKDLRGWTLPPDFNNFIATTNYNQQEFVRDYVSRWKSESDNADHLSQNLEILLTGIANDDTFYAGLIKLVNFMDQNKSLTGPTKLKKLDEQISLMRSQIQESRKTHNKLLGYRASKLSPEAKEEAKKAYETEVRLLDEKQKVYESLIGLSREFKRIKTILKNKLKFDFDDEFLIDKLHSFIGKNRTFLRPLLGMDIGQSANRMATDEQYQKVIEDFISADIDSRKYILRNTNNPSYFFSKIKNNSDVEKVGGELVVKNYRELYDDLRKKNYPITEKQLIDSRISLNNIKNNIMKNLGIREEDLGIYLSTYYKEFGLYNSSMAEKQLFDQLHKFGLSPIPANDSPIVYFDLEGTGKNRGFIIDFILPCQMCNCGDDGCSLSDTVKICGEYFGYYGKSYEIKKAEKIKYQKMFEPIISELYLHFDSGDYNNPCPKLNQANIASSCFGSNCSTMIKSYVPSNIERQKNYIISKKHIFLYTYLVNEAIRRIPGEKKAENLTQEIYREVVKDRTGEFIAKFDGLMSELGHENDNEYYTRACNDIFESYMELLNREYPVAPKSRAKAKQFAYSKPEKRYKIRIKY